MMAAMIAELVASFRSEARPGPAGWSCRKLRPGVQRTVWRPHGGNSDHFLELNVTNDQIDLAVINELIPIFPA